MSDTRQHDSLSLTQWQIDLKKHLARLREEVETPFDFSLQKTLKDALQSSWDNVKSLPPNFLDRDDERSPVPYPLLETVFPCEFDSGVRHVGQQTIRLGNQPLNVLTLSAGGAKGAYGAGLVAGWSASGKMPDFDVVMGVSTGAIVALFSFIGAFEHLYAFYHNYGTDDLVEKQVVQGLTTGAAIYDNVKFVQLLHDNIDDVVVKKIAQAAEENKHLFVGTTNLDRGLPVKWDLTKIASSKSPFAKKLIIDIMTASCAIPVAFPPVLMSVSDNDGNEYEELHVDGAASLQMLIDVPADKCNVYAVLNKRLKQPYRPVKEAIFDIGNQSLSSAMASAITSDTHRLYAVARRTHGTLNTAWIGNDFSVQEKELFDKAFMQSLYAYGHEQGFSGKAWRDQPPYF